MIPTARIPWQEYSLSGADQASFDIDAATGQLITEMKFDQESKDKYTVTVTARDTEGATDTIRVDIYVVDVDEAPEGQAPPRQRIPSSMSRMRLVRC